MKSFNAQNEFQSKTKCNNIKILIINYKLLIVLSFRGKESSYKEFNLKKLNLIILISDILIKFYKYKLIKT